MGDLNSQNSPTQPKTINNCMTLCFSPCLENPFFWPQKKLQSQFRFFPGSSWELAFHLFRGPAGAAGIAGTKKRPWKIPGIALAEVRWQLGDRWTPMWWSMGRSCVPLDGGSSWGPRTAWDMEKTRRKMSKHELTSLKTRWPGVSWGSKFWEPRWCEQHAKRHFH